MGEVLVRLLLPAGAPHRLERVRQQTKVFARRGRKEVGDAVYHLEASSRPRVLREAEQRDHPVDVDEQQGPIRVRAHPHSLPAAPTFIADEAGPVLCPDPGDELKRSLRTADDDGEEPASAAGRGLLTI